MVKVGFWKVPRSSAGLGRRGQASHGASPPSLLLFLVAGAGCPAAHHLAPDLLHELWVLLLHLLCKLLAPADIQETDCASSLLWAASTRPSSHSRPSPTAGPPCSPLGPECHHHHPPLPGHQHQQEEYSRLDEAGQVTLLRTAARSTQRVMASRDHARHAAGERTEHRPQPRPSTSHDPQAAPGPAPTSCPFLLRF